MDASGRALKRLARYLVAYALAGIVQYGVKDLAQLPWYPMFQPLIAAGIAALGKFIREYWGVRVPF